MANVHKNIKLYRLESKMTQEELGEKIFTTRQAISSYETARTTPSIEVLKLLADGLNVSIEMLVYGDEMRKKRTRLNRGAYICLAIFFVLIFVSSATLCFLNIYIPIENGMEITREVRDMVKLRFDILNFRNMISGFSQSFVILSAIVLCCFDLITRPRVKLIKKFLFYLVFVLGTVCIPFFWSFFDPIYKTIDYMIMPITSIVVSSFIMILNVAINYKKEIINFVASKLPKGKL